MSSTASGGGKGEECSEMRIEEREGKVRE